MSALKAAEGLAQIDALTRGLDLPVEPLAEIHVSIVLDYLQLAWGAVKRKHARFVATTDEASLNAFMEAELKNLQANDPVFRLLAAAISRGSEAPNYDGTLIEKRPDLNIHPTDRRTPFPVTVECKIIDKSGRSARLYCEKGVVRYAKGDYGWGQRQGFMLAYARDNCSVSKDLLPALGSVKGCATIPTPTLVPGSTVRALSRHRRTFVYPTKSPPKNKPGPIALWHLWLT